MALLNSDRSQPGDLDPVIEVSGLWKIFGGPVDAAHRLATDGASRATIQQDTGALVAVKDVSFSVAAGETFVVMGLSGSGKSTLIRCLARLTEPTMGSVSICGADVTSLDAEGLRDLRRHRLSMVFQHFGLFPHRTVLDNVAFGLEVRGISQHERRERALELLETVGLAGWGDHHPQQLSGGMQQRVGLARALAVDPDVLFFDEPFSALDPLIRRDMQDELIELQLKLQRTLVFITHDFSEALRLADRIAIMRDGEFVQVGTAVEIITNPANDYVRAFTQDAPKAKVLTAHHAMGPVGRVGDARSLHSIGQWTVLEDFIPRLLSTPDPLAVTNDVGEVIGVVTHADVARLLQPAADPSQGSAGSSSVSAEHGSS
ncbi:MAG: glycine betaine/L-proline ABC transporter ATP-binding protein [Ilumatobacteraceae bacterium]